MPSATFVPRFTRGQVIRSRSTALVGSHARRTMAPYGRRQSPPRTVPARARRRGATAARRTPTTVLGALHRAHQAADHRAAAHHHGARRWSSPSRAGRATSLVLVTLLGGTLAAGGANAINMYVDRDIDALMARTQGRPLVTGVIPARNALVFALALEVRRLRRAVGGRQPAVGRAGASAPPPSTSSSTRSG